MQKTLKPIHRFIQRNVSPSSRMTIMNSYGDCFHCVLLKAQQRELDHMQEPYKCSLKETIKCKMQRLLIYKRKPGEYLLKVS